MLEICKILTFVCPSYRHLASCTGSFKIYNPTGFFKKKISRQYQGEAYFAQESLHHYDTTQYVMAIVILCRPVENISKNNCAISEQKQK